MKKNCQKQNFTKMAETRKKVTKIDIQATKSTI